MRASLVSLLKRLVVGWACLWVAALPLFHTHLPGALEQGAGLPHTIFSSDLPGEFSAFSHRTAGDEAELCPLAFHSQELGFVVSVSSDDGTCKPLVQAASLPLSATLPLTTVTMGLLDGLPRAQGENFRSSDSHGLRAPPLPVSA